MKKTFSLSKDIVLKLEQVARDQSTTMSRIVETSLIVYMMMQVGAPDQTKKLMDLIPNNQMSIFDVLQSKSKSRV